MCNALYLHPADLEILMSQTLDMALCVPVLAARSVAGRFTRRPEGGGFPIAARSRACRMRRGPTSNAMHGA